MTEDHQGDALPAQADADVPDWEGDPGELTPGGEAQPDAGPSGAPPTNGAPAARMGAKSIVVLVVIAVLVGGFLLWVLLERGPQEAPVDRLGQPSRPLPEGPPPAELAAGAELFAANCAQCHGPNAEGQTGPSLRTRGLGPQSLADNILVGFVQNGGGDMAGFSGRLSVEQTSAVIDYVRWLQGFGPDSPPPGPED